MLRSSAARHLPIFGVEPALVRLFFAHVLAALLNVIAGVTAVWSQPRERRNLLLIGLGLFGAAIIPQAYQRLDAIHLLSAAFLTIGTLPLSLLVISSRARATIGLPMKALCSVTAVTVVVGALAPLPQLVGSFVTEAVQTESDGVAFLEQNGRPFPFPSRVVRVIGRMLDNLDKLSTPGERFFVGPTDLRRTNYCDTYLYHLMPKLRPATYFLEMNPLSANRPGSQLQASAPARIRGRSAAGFRAAGELRKSVTATLDAPCRTVDGHSAIRRSRRIAGPPAISRRSPLPSSATY